MNARPLLFSTPMVRALLEGRKTQTRRVAHFPPAENGRPVEYVNHQGAKVWGLRHGADLLEALNIRCPYGLAGDLLWVRETWGIVPMHSLTHVVSPSDHIVYKAGRRVLDSKNRPADADMDKWPVSLADDIAPEKWRPSIHMPRSASRLTLRITDVRVERLQEISPEDAEAEGLWYSQKGDDAGFWFAGPDRQPKNVWGDGSVECYMRLWASINGPGSWDANPWVWAITFEVIHKNVDAVLKEAA